MPLGACSVCARPSGARGCTFCTMQYASARGASDVLVKSEARCKLPRCCAQGHVGQCASDRRMRQEIELGASGSAAKGESPKDAVPPKLLSPSKPGAKQESPKKAAPKPAASTQAGAKQESPEKPRKPEPPAQSPRTKAPGPPQEAGASQAGGDLPPTQEDPEQGGEPASGSGTGQQSVLPFLPGKPKGTAAKSKATSSGVDLAGVRAAQVSTAASDPRANAAGVGACGTPMLALIACSQPAVSCQLCTCRRCSSSHPPHPQPAVSGQRHRRCQR